MAMWMKATDLMETRVLPGMTLAKIMVMQNNREKRWTHSQADQLLIPRAGFDVQSASVRPIKFSKQINRVEEVDSQPRRPVYNTRSRTRCSNCCEAIKYSASTR